MTRSQHGTQFLLAVAILGIMAGGGCRKSDSAEGSAQGGVASAVKATKPIAYFRLQSTSGASEVGASTFQSAGGASVSSSCKPNAHCLALDGTNGWITTTQNGGVSTAASIMAWVNLDELPSKNTTHQIFYVAGESESGNDLDLQFEGDDALRWFTSGGGSLEYKPDPNKLPGHWHMIVAVMDTTSRVKEIYWDGQRVAANADAGSPNKKAPFSIGESTYFTGRHLKGRVDEVALWDRALSADEVARIYAARD